CNSLHNCLGWQAFAHVFGCKFTSSFFYLIPISLEIILKCTGLTTCGSVCDWGHFSKPPKKEEEKYITKTIT
ncbi:MAG: hypothetical protein ACK56F_15830, partial [bacterium]